MSSAEIIAETGIKSPCTRVCVVHPATRLCIGCGRSIGEIARWIELTDAERDRIMAQLPARLTAHRAGAGAIASA
jgi:predicted Fe-S protein YdhL (DUF1289 family)